MTDHIHTPDDPRIFVFGSNLQGIHGAGAALYARKYLGALQRVPEGHMGGAYALPTCSAPGEPLPLDQIAVHVQRFLHAARHLPPVQQTVGCAIRGPGERFFVSRIGCGFAGYKDAQIAPMFRTAPGNVDLPPGWRTP